MSARRASVARGGPSARLKPHPLTTLFPAMAGAEYQRLKEDIRRHGLREPILTHRGAIVDGRQRYRACRDLGIEARTREWDGTGSFLDLIVSLNLYRRHLSESQRAIIAARLADLYAAREGEARGRRTKSADLRSLPQGKRTVRAAQAMRVGARTVELARRVLRSGSTELIGAVERDELAVTLAAEATRLPVGVQREMLQRGGRALRAAVHDHARAERPAPIGRSKVQTRPFSSLGRFTVIYADPPWRYDHSRSRSRAIENHYSTMTLEEICALPVASIATDDAALFLWATAPKLNEAMEVMKKWGFRYRTALIWDKGRIGMGYWVRGQYEQLLIGPRGKMAPPVPSARPASVIRAPRGEHSRKPEIFRRIIEEMCPGVPRIELFARGPAAKGWAVWGNEAIPEAMQETKAPKGFARHERRAEGQTTRRDDYGKRTTHSSARAQRSNDGAARAHGDDLRRLSRSGQARARVGQAMGAGGGDCEMARRADDGGVTGAAPRKAAPRRGR